jgi:hypothetical protein
VEVLPKTITAKRPGRERWTGRGARSRPAKIMRKRGMKTTKRVMREREEKEDVELVLGELF